MNSPFIMVVNKRRLIMKRVRVPFDQKKFRVVMAEQNRSIAKLGLEANIIQQRICNYYIYWLNSSSKKWALSEAVLMV